MGYGEWEGDADFEPTGFAERETPTAIIDYRDLEGWMLCMALAAATDAASSKFRRLYT